MSQPISRRAFLKTSVITAAAGGIVLCGGGAFAATYRPPVPLPTTSYGENNMSNQHILIAYASKAGSTAEVAQRIGKVLADGGQRVDVQPAAKVKDLSAYSAVVVGSAIRAGHLLPEAMKFIETHRQELAQKPFSAFIVCLTLKDDTPENRKTVSAYLDPLRAVLPPAHEGMFAGVMDPSRLTFIERTLMKMMKAPSGDFRRWDEIESWAAALA